VICCGQTIAGVCGTYADRPCGAITALVGSSDRLEIAIVGGNARAALGAAVGEKVFVVKPAPPKS
jgi:S-adenosylmethionine hydrolase